MKGSKFKGDEMIKNIATLEVKIGERIYKLLCDIDSPLGEVHDSLSQMKNYVIERINAAHKAAQDSQCDNCPNEVKDGDHESEQ